LQTLVLKSSSIPFCPYGPLEIDYDTIKHFSLAFVNLAFVNRSAAPTPITEQRSV